jgi:hypothetical protein
MPLRLLREGILTSDRVNELDAPAEVFYRRLMSVVDDHGLFDARLRILRTELYPLRIDHVKETSIAGWLKQCVTARLLRLYEVDGKPFLQMLDTNWQVRSKPKWPTPPVDNPVQNATASNCSQVSAPAHLDEGVFVSSLSNTEGENARTRAAPSRKRLQTTQMPEGFGAAPSERVASWAKEKGYERIDEHLTAFVGKCAAKDYRYADWDAAFMEAIREDWAKLRGPRAAPPPEKAVAQAAQKHSGDVLAQMEAARKASQTPEARAAAQKVRAMLADGVIKRAA